MRIFGIFFSTTFAVNEIQCNLSCLSPTVEIQETCSVLWPRRMILNAFVISGSAHGLLPAGTKTVRKPMLVYHRVERKLLHFVKKAKSSCHES